MRGRAQPLGLEDSAQPHPVPRLRHSPTPLSACANSVERAGNPTMRCWSPSPRSQGAFRWQLARIRTVAHPSASTVRSRHNRVRANQAERRADPSRVRARRASRTTACPVRKCAPACPASNQPCAAPANRTALLPKRPRRRCRFSRKRTTPAWNRNTANPVMADATTRAADEPPLKPESRVTVLQSC